MRRIPAQMILSKNEEFDLDQTTWHGHLPQLRQEYTELALGMLKDGLPQKLSTPTACIGKGSRGLPVMEVCIPDMVDEQQATAVFDQMADETLISMGGSETWIMSYMTAHVMDALSYESRNQASSMLYQRMRILNIVARLLRTDLGLTMGRRRTIFGMFLELLHPHPSMLTETPYRDHFANLMQATKWSVARDEAFHPQDPRRPVREQWRGNWRTTSSATATPTSTCRSTASAPPSTPSPRSSRRPKLWALPAPWHLPRRCHRECPLCRQHMTHGPGQPPVAAAAGG